MVLRGKRLTGTAHLVAPSSDQFRASVESTLRRVPGMGRAFKVDFDKRTGLTQEQVVQLGAEIAVVRIEPDTGAG